MTRDEALQRIRELRALADRTTYAGEADAALSKVERLMTKFGIFEEELAEPEPVPQPPWVWPAGAVVVIFQAPFSHGGYYTNVNITGGIAFNIIFR